MTTLLPPAPAAETRATLDAPAEPAARGWSVWGPGALLCLLLVAPQLGTRSLWMDESFTLGAINQFGATFRHTGGTMSLYYALLAPWAAVSHDAGWLRIPSLAFAVLAIVALGCFARRAYGVRAARLACLVCAGSMLVTVYAEEARSYTLVLALATWTWLALDHLVRGDDEPRVRTRWAIGFAVAWALLPWAHGLSTLQLGAQIAVLLVARVPGATWRRVAPAVVLGLVGTGLGTVLGGGSSTTWVPPFSSRDVVNVAHWLTNLDGLGFAVLAAAAGFGVLASVLALRTAAGPVDRFRAFAPVCWALLPFLGLIILSFQQPLMVSRYLIPSAAGLAVLVALGVLWIGRRLAGATSLDPRIAMALPIVPVALILAMGQVTVRTRAGADWRRAADAIAARAHPGDVVAFPEPRDRVPFEVAWSGADRPPYPEPITPARPFGAVRYFDGVVDGRGPVVHLPAGHRVFVVFQPASASSRADVKRLLDQARADHRVSWSGDFQAGVQVWLLTPS